MKVGDYIRCINKEYNLTNKNAVCKILTKGINDNTARVKVISTTDIKRAHCVGDIYTIYLQDFKLAEEYKSPVYCALMGIKYA